MRDFPWNPNGDNIFDNSYAGQTLGDNSDTPFAIKHGSLTVDMDGELTLMPQGAATQWDSASVEIVKGTLNLKYPYLNQGIFAINSVKINTYNDGILKLSSKLYAFIDVNIKASSVSSIEIFTYDISDISGSIKLIENSNFKIIPPGEISENYYMGQLNTDISIVNNSKMEITSPYMIFETELVDGKPGFCKFYIGQSLDDREELSDSNVYDASLTISAYDKKFPIDFTSGTPLNVKFIFRVTDNKGKPIKNKGKLIMVGLGGFGAAFFQEGGYLYIDDKQIVGDELAARFDIRVINGTMTVKLK